MSPASTNPSPPGVTGICASTCARAERQQHEPRPRVRADRRERGEQRARGRGPSARRTPRARASSVGRASRGCGRARAAAATGRPRSGSARGRSRLRTRCAVRPIQRSGPVGREQDGADADRHGEDRRGRRRPCTSSSRSTDPRSSAGIAEDGQREDDGEDEQVRGRQPATVEPGGRPACTSIRYCSAAPSAPPPGATFDSALPASWRGDDRPPARRAQRPRAAAPTGRRATRAAARPSRASAGDRELA